MKLPGRTTLIVDLGCAAVLLWLYGGDVLDYRRALVSEVSALPELPHVGFAVLALAATIAGLGLLAWGALRGKPDGFKGYRVLPILLVLFLFIDLFIVSGSRGPAIPPANQLAASMDLFADAVNRVGAEGALPTQSRELEPIVDKLGQPPYLVRGQRVPRYSLQVRQGCDKPILDAPGVQVGTILYCTAPGGKVGWITVMALPAESHFGSPSVFSIGGQPRWWTAYLEPPEEGAGQADGGAP